MAMFQAYWLWKSDRVLDIWFLNTKSCFIANTIYWNALQRVSEEGQATRCQFKKEPQNGFIVYLL